MRHSLILNINWELKIDLRQLQKDKLDMYKCKTIIFICQFLRSKMFVSNDLTRVSDQKCSEEINVIITEINTFSSTREILKKIEELLLYFSCEYFLIYQLNKQDNLLSIIFTSALIFSNLQFVFTFRGVLRIHKHTTHLPLP